MIPLTLPIVNTSTARGDALVIHARVGSDTGVRVRLLIDGKPQKETEVILLKPQPFSFSVVALLEPGEHTITFDVVEGVLDLANIDVVRVIP